MALEIQDISYRIQQRDLIKKISLSFEPGYLYGILGPNGSGKSTLLKVMARIWTPTQGKLFWKGENLLAFSRIKMSKTISLVPQNPHPFFDFDVSHMVSMGLYPKNYTDCETQKIVEKSLKQVDAWHLRHQPLMTLSGGERQRVYIARSLATGSPVMLLDEPTTYLDLRHQLEIWELLRDLAAEGRVVIAAVHDLPASKRFCDKLVLLKGGECQGEGAFDELMTPSCLRDIFGIKRNTIDGSLELYRS